MKTCPAHGVSGARRIGAAFTLPEYLVTMTIFVLLIVSAMTAYIYGLRMYEYTKPKLSASDQARQVLSLLTHEVRSANLVRIGDGGLSSFTEIAPNTLQLGSAIQLYPTTNRTDFVRYYWSTTDKTLRRTTNGTSFTYVMAQSISNQMVFSSEDYQGNILTNNENNRVIGLTLQFYQIQYPIMTVGPGNYYDFYQVRAKITRRSLL